MTGFCGSNHHCTPERFSFSTPGPFQPPRGSRHQHDWYLVGVERTAWSQAIGWRCGCRAGVEVLERGRD